MKILILIKSGLESIPPLLSQAKAASDCGHEVTIISAGSARTTRENLESNNINTIQVYDQKAVSTIFDKILNWYTFRKEAKKTIKNLEFDAIWLGSADTAICMLGALPKKQRSKSILSIFELYDQYPIYRFLLELACSKSHAVIVPEETRADILEVWLNLKSRPIVIPNKPYPNENITINTPRFPGSTITELKSCGQEMVLYQGWISSTRNLRSLADAVSKSNDHFLVLMGQDIDGEVEIIRKINDSVIHIPFISPPDHLEVTRMADVGIISYKKDRLNNLFCAPNKTWEYSKYGIPILSENLPSMRYQLKNMKFGTTCDMSDAQSIISGLEEIKHNKSKFAEAGKKFYDSVDLKNMIQAMLSSI
ncbi:hypothetical protein FIU97_19280 (plasmid) [Roseivivax sp. THAF40]|uniref:glycosyltransferase n=1 Tax=Roseivivax sp. THAF40 TaxID=2587858 RepID=UPI001268C8C5|nr:glycosyltransferase [Roseivivax sp. THAF40]QFT48738.1 hypothetical protein FIU97_19280 [Roseivivax sp. THAF40]